MLAKGECSAGTANEDKVGGCFGEESAGVQRSSDTKKDGRCAEERCSNFEEGVGASMSESHDEAGLLERPRRTEQISRCGVA